jgi:hypothetical protein
VWVTLVTLVQAMATPTEDNTNTREARMLRLFATLDLTRSLRAQLSTHFRADFILCTAPALKRTGRFKVATNEEDAVSDSISMITLVVSYLLPEPEMMTHT